MGLLKKYLGFDSFRAKVPAGLSPATTNTATPDFRQTSANDNFSRGLMAYSGQMGYAPAVNSILDGDKFPGGFGVTNLYSVIDYWTLRERSGQLFRENLYAKGLIRRLITNEINTGLIPEATPDEDVLGVAEGSLDSWAELQESRFGIWANNPHLCDNQLERTFGEIQEVARMEALIEGDVLCIMRMSRVTKLPMVQLVRGNRVRSPFSETIRKGHIIEQGVEMDKRRRQVAYWIMQDDGTFKRVPAFGEKSGRRIAWLHYGTERRVEDVRGEPLLAVILQSLKEIDRYRDSTQRKAVINSLLAMFIKKTQEVPGSTLMSGAAVRKTDVAVGDNDTPSSTRNLQLYGYQPGIVAEELSFGEEPVMKGGEGTDINFPVFEEAIIQAVAWCNEVPPEILRLTFSNNYSASQAAINEYKIYLNKRWKRTGDTLCTPIYIEWMLSEALIGKVSTPGLLESWRDPQQYDTFGSLTMVEWYGSIKPSTDMLKATKGSKTLVAEGWSTNAREARGLTGTKFKRNIRRLKRENAAKAEAMRPLAEFNQEFDKTPDQVESEAAAVALEETVDLMLEERGIEDVA